MQSHTFRILSVFTILFFATTLVSEAQVKIGDNHKEINSSALLELESTNKGLVFPRVELDSLITVWGLAGDKAIDGMVVFNTNTINHSLGLYSWYNNQWNIVGSGSADDSRHATNVHNYFSEDSLLSYLADSSALEGDIFYHAGHGVYIRNDNENATTLAEGYVFVSGPVHTGNIFYSQLSDVNNINLDDFDIAVSDVFYKPDTAIFISVDTPPTSTRAYYSFAFPSEWDTPIISLRLANANQEYFNLNDCWNVERGVVKDGQLYQIWTLDVPLSGDVMSESSQFRIY